MTRLEAVRSFFDQTDRYLGLRYYIDVRAQIVGELCGDLESIQILDIGCGNGAISKQFYVTGRNDLTLVDISGNMLELARRNFASTGFADGDAAFVLGDVDCLPANSAFDYVLALGLLGHADNPRLLIAKLAALLKPEGRLVLQFVDSGTRLGALHWYHQAFRELVTKSRGYMPSRLEWSQVQRHAGECGLTPEALVRHRLTLPGMDRLIPDRILFKLDSVARTNRFLSRFGSDCIVMFNMGC